MSQFNQDIIRMHGDLLNRELSPKDKEMLCYLLEAMTNIDTDLEEKVFFDLISCYPKLDYSKLL